MHRLPFVQIHFANLKHGLFHQNKGKPGVYCKDLWPVAHQQHPVRFCFHGVSVQSRVLFRFRVDSFVGCEPPLDRVQGSRKLDWVSGVEGSDGFQRHGAVVRLIYLGWSRSAKANIRKKEVSKSAASAGFLSLGPSFSQQYASFRQSNQKCLFFLLHGFFFLLLFFSEQYG